MQLSKRSISIGEVLKFAINVSVKPKVNIRFPKDIDSQSSFEIKDTKLYKKTAFGKEVYTKEYYLTSYDTGEQNIPQFTIEYKYPGSVWKYIVTSKVKVEVESILKKVKIEADIKPIEPPVGMRLPYRRYLLLFIPAGAALFLVVFYIKRKREIFKKAKKGPSDLLTSYQRLKSFLISLRSDGAIEQSDLVRLAELTKKYLAHRLKLSSKSMTTEEFLSSIKAQRDFYDRHGESLGNFLRRSDMIKFANHMIDTQERVQTVLWAKKLLNEIQPLEERHDR